MSNEANMPIYPAQEIGPSGTPNHEMLYGLTKREEFASRNMAAILANGNYEAPRRHRFSGMAEDALAAADALLAALEAEKGGE